MRCKKGTRRNKITGKCEKNKKLNKVDDNINEVDDNINEVDDNINSAFTLEKYFEKLSNKINIILSRNSKEIFTYDILDTELIKKNRGLKFRASFSH